MSIFVKIIIPGLEDVIQQLICLYICLRSLIEIKFIYSIKSIHVLRIKVLYL